MPWRAIADLVILVLNPPKKYLLLLLVFTRRNGNPEMRSIETMTHVALFFLTSKPRAPIQSGIFLGSTILSTRQVSTRPHSSSLLKKDPVSSPPSDSLSNSSQRFEKLFNKTPKFLRSWIQPISSKPFSHIVSFLILHEVMPLAFVTNARSPLWSR
jgi:Hypothetical protein FLILHELTA